jgi:hypothetical protein
VKTNSGLAKGTYKEEDFTLSFALFLRTDATVDFWKEKDN